MSLTILLFINIEQGLFRQGRAEGGERGDGSWHPR